ncbi:unnamed protein product [Nesidiocoris tenuis]|uniref:snRNA-activating protein complex subunit 4 n=1 Tax=Nesidiocoris tenuis TaxID=355587 RepID=A0A6H5GNB7_9HEMI|nr:unnamed protein product [Nesidiocoris tenuis]
MKDAFLQQINKQHDGKLEDTEHRRQTECSGTSDRWALRWSARCGRVGRGPGGHIKMSEEESENTDGLEILTDEEDAAKDLELMKDIMQSIEASKREDDSSQEPPVRHGVLPPEKKAPNLDVKPGVVAIDEMQLTSLNRLLEQLNQALECNQGLQHALILKEVKLIALQRRILSNKTRESEYLDFQKDKEDDLKGDIGRFIVRFKAPYFKDSRNFASYSVVPRGSFPKTAQYFEERAVEWKKPDLKELETGVKKYLASRELRSTINAKNSTRESRVAYLAKFNDSTSASLSKLVPPDFDQIIDWCLIASKLGKLHTPYECQKAWDIFLKPTLNRKPWSKTEKERLKEIALEHNYEDWDTIAEELGSSRSGYQCFHEFQDLISKIAEGDWSKEENECLVKLVKECSYGEKILWHKVAYYFGTRSLSQIYRKWNLSSVSKQYKSGPFSEYEDQLILNKMLKDDSTATMNLVARQLNRMGCQIRYRYTQLITSLKVKFGAWSMEEDKLLLECVEKFGSKNWAKVAKHVPQRDRIQCRHRHRHIKERMKKFPNMKLEDFERERRTVYKDRKQATLKYVMNLAGIQERPPPDGSEVFKISTAVGDLVINPEDLEEDENSPKKGRTRNKKGPEASKTSNSTSRHGRPSRVVLRGKPGKKKSKRATKPAAPQGNRPSGKLSSDPIVGFYRRFAHFKGDPGQPKSCCDSRPDVKAISKVLDFKPDKNLDVKNAEWVYVMDKYDPYYRDVLETAENLRSGSRGGPADRLKRGAVVIPPSVSLFEGFYNLLKDMDFKESDLDEFDPDELATLCGNGDEEMADAMLKWKDRLKSLFLWPSALSQVDVVTGESQKAKTNLAREETNSKDQNPQQDDNAVIDMSEIPEEIREAILQPENLKVSAVLGEDGQTLLELDMDGSSDSKTPLDTKGATEASGTEDSTENLCK